MFRAAFLPLPRTMEVSGSKEVDELLSHGHATLPPRGAASSCTPHIPSGIPPSRRTSPRLKRYRGEMHDLFYTGNTTCTLWMRC